MSVFISSLRGALKPFWIYWGTLVGGCMLFLICPVLLFVILPVILIMIPIGLIIIYFVGIKVQQRSRLNKVSQRIVLAFGCSFLIMAIFPVFFWVYDIVKWNEFHISSLIDNFRDRILWIEFVLNFFAFWIGEEIGRITHTAEGAAENKEDRMS